MYSMETNKTDNNSKAKELVNNIIDVTYDKMDDNNKKAANILKTEGIESAVKHMFIDQRTGNKLSYGEMRARYG